MTTPVNVCILFGPTLLADLTDDIPNDFQAYPGYESPDGKVAKAHPGGVAGLDPLRRQGPLLGGPVQLPQRGGRPHERRPGDADVHLPQQPRPHRLHRRHREPRARGSVRPRHRSRRPARAPEARSASPSVGCTTSTTSTACRSRTRRTRSAARRTTPRSSPVQVPTSHLSHVELREGKTADDSTPKRGEMVRRSTPYAFHDGTVGLYFMGFCREQAPMRERMEAIYGMNGHEPRRPHRLLDAGIRLVLLRAVGRDAGGGPRKKPRPAASWRGHKPFGNCSGYRYEAMPMNVHSAVCAETLSLFDSTTIVALALGR